MLKIFRTITVILLASWMLLIFSLSAETAETSSKTSGRLKTVIIALFFEDFDELPKSEQDALSHKIQFYVRKTAHFTIYGILGVLAFLSIVTYKKLSFKLRTVLPLFFCILYSVGDEFHQTFVNGRSGELRDVFIDSCGALLGIAFAALIVKLCKFKFIKKYT